MALAAIDAQRCRTIFNDFPQKSLGPVSWLFLLYPLPDTRTTPYASCRFEPIRHLFLKPPPHYSASAKVICFIGKLGGGGPGRFTAQASVFNLSREVLHSLDPKLSVVS